MRNIRVIIAFLGIYAFVFAVAIVVGFCLWLSRYSPDSSLQPMLTMSATALSGTTAKLSGKLAVGGVTALSSTITRINDTQPGRSIAFERQTPVMFVSISRVTFSEQLVPLGYFSMARITSITDANGEVVYQSPNSIVDFVYGKLLLQNFCDVYEQALTLVAKTNPTSYTVTNTPTGITQHED